MERLKTIKKIVFLFFLTMVLFSGHLLAYSIGPSTATVATNVSGWTNWTVSQLSSKNDQYATTNVTAATGTLSGFDFSGIPAGSTIDGIIVHIQASESNVQADGYLMTYLSWDNGTSYTSGYRTPDSGELPTSDTDYNEGGASDTWGHSWTVSEVTSTFKVKIWGYCAATARLTQVDYVAVTIYYSDGISPGAITTLSALTSSVPGAIDLTWTAPGDDGYTNNIVGGKYRIKASTNPGYSFVYTDYDVEIPTSTTQGAEESYTLSDLTSGATYYIRIWTADEKPNWSEISNGATTWAQIVPEWWNSSWLCRNKLTFDNSSQSENLTDFPVLVKLTSSNFNFNLAKSNGEDIRFIDSNNYTELKYEIERWDNSAQQAIVWVKVPEIDGSSNQDFIYMYYGNSSAYENQSSTSVWTNGYVAVYHFSELSGYYQDSTKNSNDANTQKLTSRNNTDANGLGYYPGFVETNGDYVGVPDNSSLDFGTGDFTVMVRAKSSTTQIDSDLVRKGSTGVPENSWWKLEWGPTVNNRVAWSITISGTEKVINYNTLNPDGNWHDIWGTRDTTNTQIELFIDAISKGTATGNNDDISNSWNIGIGSKDTYNDDFYGGYLDEVRLANVLRSDDWIAAQSKSLSNTFINIGNEESPKTAVSKYTGGSPLVPPSTVDKNTTGNCLGTFHFGGKGDISQIIITEYGTCDAPNDLENVKLFKDDGDGNWELTQDTTQLGSTTTFSGTSSTATFSGFSLTAGATCYVHVILDVKETATYDQTIGIETLQSSHVTSTEEVAATSWPVQLGTSTISVPKITVGNYTGGTPAVPPSTVPKTSIGNCLGTLKFDGIGEVSQITLTEYGTCDADSDLENVKLFEDDGDGNWESSQDTTQLGSTTTFNAGNKATFSSLSLGAGSTTYVHVVLDVKSTANDGDTIGIELYQDDIVCTTTATASGWPVQLGTSTIQYSAPKSFQEGVYPTASYDGTRDTQIQGGANADINYGIDETVKVDAEIDTLLAPSWALFRWIISADIPAGSTVSEAEITLYVDPSDTGAAFDFYELKKDWVEGDGTSGSGATWNTYDGSTNWDTAGAEGSGDRGSVVLGTIPGSAGSHTVVLNSTGVALVQNWVDNPSSNCGVILRGASSSGTGYFTSENSATTNRPKLTVTYIPPTPAETTVSAYTDGSPTVPPNYVYTQSTGNCLGTFRFDGVGTVSQITLTEYGSCDAANDLENVKLFKDDGDGDWESGYDTTQLGSTTTFSGASSTATFSGFSLVACSTCYVHVVLDVKDTATTGETIGIEIAQASDVTSTENVTASSWPVQLGTSYIGPVTVVSNYTGGTPTVPPSGVTRPSTHTCLGTFLFNGTGTISEITVTEYGTCDADSDLENVKFFQDDGDGNWEKSQDTTQLGSTTTFNASNKATFSGLNLIAGSTTYVHMVLDVKSSATIGQTIGIGLYQNDIVCTSTTTASSWPVQLGTSIISIPQITVSNYTGGSPTVPPSNVYKPSTGNCLGTFKFAGEGTISQITLTEYGTCNATSDLENVKLFQDDGDGNWESSQDTTQLGSTTTFSGSSSTATFSGLTLTASATSYVHVVLDVTSNATNGQTVGIELYQNDIVCTTTTTASGWPVQLGTSNIATYTGEAKAKVGSFAKPNATTGNQSITGIGFQPKLVIFFGNYLTADGNTTGAREFFGAAVSSTKRAVIASASGDVANSPRDKRWSNALVITQITEPTPTVNAEADFVSMDSDGFTINWTTCDASQRIINYIALGGSDLTNVNVGSFTAPTAAGDRAVTGVGFQPDALIIFDNTVTTTPTAVGNAASSAFNIGFVVGTTKQSSRSTMRQDGTASTWGYQRTNSCQNSVSGAGAVVRTATIKTMDAGGFTLNFSVAPANAVYINYIALKGGQYDTGSFNQATSVGNQSVTTGFTPVGVLFQSVNIASSTAVSSVSRISFGVGVSSSERGSIWSGDEDAQTDSDLDRTKSLKCLTEGTPTLNTAMDFVSNDTNGFTVNNTTVDATSREILYFAFGSSAAAPQITVSKYTGGSPIVPPSNVYKPSTGNCLGTFKFAGEGTISQITLTEYGTCNATSDLENVKLFQDDGDGNWESSQDTTQLDSTTTFSGSSSTATFSGLTLTASATSYVHVVLDVTSNATNGQAVGTELYQNDIVCTTTTTASGWPVQLGTSTIKDATPPETVTTLSALIGDNQGEIKLSWTAPGDDGWNNNFDNGSQFDIRYSTAANQSPAISTTTFSACSSVSGFSSIPTPVTALWPYSMTITGLTPGVTYYFAMKTGDEVPNWSGLSNGATTWAKIIPDTTAPAAITDLTGLCDSDTGEVTLYWSTPGDDEWTGTLPSGSKYIIDYSSYSIQWSTATFDVEISTSGVDPHTQVSHTITGLTGDTTWYFQIWTRDEVPTNWSGLSNGATVWVNPVLSVSISTNTYDFGEVPLSNSTHTVSIIAVTNEGNVKQTYSLKISSVVLSNGDPSLWEVGIDTDTAPANDKFLFYSIFHGTDVALNYFKPNDITTEDNQISTSERFTYEDDGPYKQTGENVPPGEERKLWFRLDMPTGVTTAKEEKITITISAEKSP